MQHGAKIVAPLKTNILSNFRCTVSSANTVQPGAKFYTMHTKFNANHFDDGAFTQKPTRHNFPDVLFPDGRVMVYDEILELYVDAPVGYKRTDMIPFIAGEIQVIPHIDTVPTDDQLRRHKEQIKLQWIGFASWISQIAMLIGVVLGAIAAGGYVWQVIRAFGENGAPRVAELTGAAIGHILAVVLYLAAAVVGGFMLMSFFGSLRKGSTEPEYQSASGYGTGTRPDYGGGAKQNIVVNIAGRDFSGGNDPAQQIIQ